MEILEMSWGLVSHESPQVVNVALVLATTILSIAAGGFLAAKRKTACKNSVALALVITVFIMDTSILFKILWMLLITVSAIIFWAIFKSFFALPTQ